VAEFERAFGSAASIPDTELEFQNVLSAIKLYLKKCHKVVPRLT